MADDQERTGPSLEPPSLFRRKRKKDPEPSPAPAAHPAEQAPVGPAPEADDSPTTILDDVGPEMTQPLTPPVPATTDTPPPLFADEVATRGEASAMITWRHRRSSRPSGSCSRLGATGCEGGAW